MLPFFENKDAELFVFEYSEFGFPAHFHPSIEIVCSIEGEMGIVVDGESHLLRKDEIGVIFPDRVHRYEHIPNTNSRGYLMLVSGKLMGEYRAMTENALPKNCIIKKEELDEDCITALERLRHMQDATLLRQKAYARMVLCHLFEKLEITESEKCEEAMVYRLVDYMERHFAENISLDTLSEALHANRYSLSRIFSSQLGMSFNDYLNSLRINRATELVQNGETISSAAFEAGFNNLRTFNRAFLKLMGKTPSEYLKNA